MTNPQDIAADVAVGSAGAGATLGLWMHWLQGAEGLVIGALVIWLTILRIRSHLRRDHEKEGPQRDPAQTP